MEKEQVVNYQRILTSRSVCHIINIIHHVLHVNKTENGQWKSGIPHTGRNRFFSKAAETSLHIFEFRL